MRSRLKTPALNGARSVYKLQARLGNQLFLSRCRLFSSQKIQAPSITLVKEFEQTSIDIKKRIIGSIYLCVVEKEINAANLRDYVITQNDWHGVVFRSSASAWSGYRKFSLQVDIDGVEWMFIIWGPGDPSANQKKDE